MVCSHGSLETQTGVWNGRRRSTASICVSEGAAVRSRPHGDDAQLQFLLTPLSQSRQTGASEMKKHYVIYPDSGGEKTLVAPEQTLKRRTAGGRS